MFDKSTRTLIAMLFERSTIDEVSGALEDGRRWDVSIHRPNLFRDDVSYEGYITGAYNTDFRGDSLDETLDKLDAYLAEETEITAMLRKAVNA